MEVLVDSGVLLRAFDKSSSDRRSILRAFRLLRDQGHAFVTTHQNIAETAKVTGVQRFTRGRDKRTIAEEQTVTPQIAITRSQSN